MISYAIRMTSSTAHLVGDMVRQELDEESDRLRHRLGIVLEVEQGIGWTVGFEENLVAYAVRLHRLAQVLEALDDSHRRELGGVGRDAGGQFDPDDCPVCCGEDLVRYCKGDDDGS